ncbi:MAG: hypothetical protein LKF50_08385 [Solobacterium sp.]|jgi:YD repeat-containing protein|nr:hypothetical protein [Solobacterium sp.]MCH4222759.1 hypothetical protein [Solobacterium sp.]
MNRKYACLILSVLLCGCNTSSLSVSTAAPSASAQADESKKLADMTVTVTTTDQDGTVLSEEQDTYNSDGNMIAKTTDQDTVTYQFAGQICTSMSDSAGETKYSYNSKGQLIQSERTENGEITNTITFTYDSQGNQITKTATDASGNVTSTDMTYDAGNRMVETKSVMLGSVYKSELTYDSDGNWIGTKFYCDSELTNTTENTWQNGLEMKSVQTVTSSDQGYTEVTEYTYNQDGLKDTVTDTVTDSEGNVQSVQIQKYQYSKNQ